MSLALLMDRPAPTARASQAILADLQAREAPMDTMSLALLMDRPAPTARANRAILADLRAREVPMDRMALAALGMDMMNPDRKAVPLLLVSKFAAHHRELVQTMVTAGAQTRASTAARGETPPMRKSD